MATGVLDAGVAIAWIAGKHPALTRMQKLLEACRAGEARLVISVVNLAEVLLHTARFVRATGIDPVTLLRGHGVEVHAPDEEIARRVARLRTSIADGFAAATALQLGARLHTTDAELVRQIRGTGLSVTHY